MRLTMTGSSPWRCRKLANDRELSLALWRRLWCRELADEGSCPLLYGSICDAASLLMTGSCSGTIVMLVLLQPRCCWQGAVPDSSVLFTLWRWEAGVWVGGAVPISARRERAGSVAFMWVSGTLVVHWFLGLWSRRCLGGECALKSLWLSWPPLGWSEVAGESLCCSLGWLRSDHWVSSY